MTRHSKSKRVRVVAYLDPLVAEHCGALADLLDVSRSSFIEDVLTDFLDRLSGTESTEGKAMAHVHALAAQMKAEMSHMKSSLEEIQASHRAILSQITFEERARSAQASVSG